LNPVQAWISFVTFHSLICVYHCNDL